MSYDLKMILLCYGASLVCGIVTAVLLWYGVFYPVAP